MPSFYLGILLLFLMGLSGCNNPKGGSVIETGNAPFLKAPASFRFTQVRAKNGTVELKWSVAKRVAKYKVYMGTSNTTITTEVTSCAGLLQTCTLTGLVTATTYYFRVDAINDAGTKPIDAIAPALSVGDFDITGSSIADGSITISWSASNNSTKYNIIYGFTPGSYSSSMSNVTSPYTLTGLTNSRTHYFRVVATNSLNGYALSTTEGSATPIGPPPVPGGVKLAASPGSMHLSWNLASGADSYKIFKGTTSGSLVEISTTTSDNFIDSTTTDGTTYYYAVKSSNALYDSSLSSEESARSISTFNMDSVTTGPSPNTLVVAWPATTGASTYNIRYGTNSASLSSQVSNVTSPYTVTGLTGGTTYYFRVVAVNAVGDGTALNSTNQLSGIPISPIAAPTGFAAVSTPGQVSLSWNSVSGASSYEVLRGTTSGSYTSLQTGILGNTFVDSTVTNGTTYYYVVRSFNGLNSPNSTEVATKPISAFSISSISPVSSSSLQISWGAAAGADAYDIRYGSVSGSYTGTVSGVVSPYTLTGLTANITYYVVVRARNAVGSGTSFQSAQSSALTKTVAPSGLVATTSPSQISVDWTNTAGALSYTIYRGTISGTLSVLASGLGVSNYTDTTVTDGTTYYYAVTATNGSESAKSSEAAARSISPFTITGTASPSPTSIEVTWPATTGASTYDIRYGTSSGSYTTTVTNKTSPATLTGLTAGTVYYIIVVGKNAVGSGSSLNSNEVSKGTPVGPPTGVIATVGSGQISISWTAMSGASSYKLYRGTVSGTYALLASGIITTSYADSTVTNGTTYYYVLKSFNGTDSADSAEVSGKTIAPYTLSSVTSTSATSIEVSFPATPGGDFYDVRYGTASGSYSTTLSSVTSPRLVSALTANTTYYVVGRARNTVGPGASRQTPEVSIKTPTVAPASLAATSTPNQVVLSWASVTGASSYKVFRGTVSGTYAEIANGVSATSYTDTTVTNGTSYYYVIRAFNDSDSTNSNEVSIQPIASHTIAATTPTANSIQVSWNAVTGATSYDVLWGTSTGSYTGSALNVSSPYSITGLTANTNYYIVVRAKNSIGAGTNVNSTEVLRKTSTAAPTGLIASASPGQVGLNWTATSGAINYKIYKGTVSGSLSLLASGVGSNAYLDTTVTNGTTYYYTVVANNGTDSLQSAEVSVRPISSLSLSSATAASASSIDLAWTSATGATTYDVRYGTSPGVYSGTVPNVTSPYTLTALTANTQYYISIRAKNSVGAGTNADSNELNATTATAVPTSLVATSITGQINLSWTAPAGASSYRIYRGTTSGSYAQIASGVTGTTYSDTTVTNGTQYFYVVRAYNGTESADSNESTAVPIGPFSISANNAPTPNTIEVSWGAATGATLYDVRYGTTSGSYTTTVSAVTSTYTITGLSSGTNYYVIVRARNTVGGGGEANTSEVSQITPIGPPTGLAASATPSAINLSWSAAGGALSYKVYRGTVSGSYAQIASGITATTYSDTSAVNGTSYYYVVRSFNGADSADSNEVASRSISNFSISSTSSPTANSIEVTWGSATGAATYDVQFGTVSGSYTSTISNVTSPYTILLLSANTTYYIRLQAKNTVGAGAIVATNEVNQKTATVAPSGLTASASPSQVGLNWTATTGATSYKVYRGTISGSLTLLATGVSTNAYLDTTVTNGTTYYYTVVSNNGSDSAQSTEVSVRPISSFSLTAVSPASSTSLDMTWGSASGASSYEVRYGTSTGVYLGSVTNVTSPYTLTGLSPNTQYFISIRASNSVGSATIFDSNEMNATTATAAPTSLTATATTGKIDLSWTAASGAASYRIYRGTSSGVYSQIATGVTTTTYSDTTIANGSQYFYVVRAFNGIESSNSNEATGQSIEIFMIASTSAPTTSTIEVNWSATAGATAYDVRFGTTSGSYSTTLSNVTSPYTITGLSGGINYFIVVRARNTIGLGSSLETGEVSQVTPLSAPTGLTAAATPGNVSLNWTAVTGAESYKVYRGTTSGSHTLLASGVLTNSYSDSTVSNGTDYFYVVTAFNGADSAISNEASVRPIASFTIAVSVLSSSSVSVSWTNPAGGSTYDIKYGTTSGTYTTTLSNQTSPVTVSGLDAGSTYYFVVDAKNAVGAGSVRTSSEVGATTAFGAPNGLAATATPATVDLTWNAVSGATSYKVLRGTVSGTYIEIAGSVATNSYTDTPVTDGTTYYYVVRAFNGSDSANSNEASIKSISTFTFSSVTVASSTSLNLSWTSATGADSYDVRYGTSSGSYPSIVAGVTSPYTLSGLSAGTTYYITIRAKNAVGAGTNINSTELNGKTSPAAPSTLAATATTGQIALTWTAGSGSTNYNVYRATASGGPYTQIASAITTTSYTDTTVSNGTQYFFVVRGYNGTESANSNEATGQAIAAFSISSTSAPTTSTIVVNWSATSGATIYDVRYGTSTGSYATTVSNVTSPYTIIGLSGGTNYYIVVRARNSIGSGAFTQTPEVTQVTPLSAPAGLAASSTPGSVSLTWNNVTGASSYKIYRGTTSGSYTSLATGIATNSYTDNTVTNGNDYFYVVKAFNGADSADSNEASTRPMANFSISGTTSPSSSSIEVTWSGPTGTMTYDVRYGTATGSYTTTVTGVTSPYTIIGLSADTNYYIVVRANNSVGAGTSVTSSETAQKTATTAPTGLAATAVPASVSLSWTAVSGATDYKVYRGTTSGSLSLLASAVLSASYTDNTVSNGITYYYAVVSNNGSDSAKSSEISIQPISAFSLSSVVSASASSLDITWTSATGATTYDVRYGTTAGTYSDSASNVTSPYTLTGLNAGTTYYVSIRAKNAVGTGTNIDSNELSALTSPGAPSSLTATATTGQIALGWSSGSGTTTNYNVYRSTATGGPYSQIATAVSATTYTDSTITNGTQYFYVVRGNNGTESANSNEATGQTIASFSISSTTAPSPTSITVSWSATAGATAYDVRYGTSTGSYTTTVSNVTSTYTITGLTSATNYYIVVRARNVIGAGSSTQTPEVIQITPLAPPSGLAATSSPGSVALTWNTLTGASSYKVYRGTTSASYSLLASGVTSTTYSDTTVANGTQYFYVVKAYNGADSADSNEATTLPMASFTISSTSSPTSSTVEVTWTGPTGSSTFDVSYGTTSGSYTTTVSSVTSPYTITVLSAGTTYYVVVRANNSVGSGTTVTSSEASQLTALGAPSGLTASAGPGSVGLNWDSQTGASSYKVYRGTTSGSLSLLASGVTTNAYMDTTVANGTIYYYTVVAHNGSDSAQSSEVSIQPISSFSLTALTAASASSIDVTWESATGASSYDVRYGTSPGVYLGTVSNVTSPYSLGSLSSGTTYYISVQAKNAVGTGTIVNSNEMNAKTGVGAPSGVAASSTPGNVSVSWTAVSGATNYNIYRATTTGGPYTQIASAVASSPYNDNTVTNGTTYYYVVRTYNGIESVNSSEVATQPIANFTLSAATVNSASSATVSWAPATGAATYDVRVGTISGSYTTTYTNVTSSYEITGLSPATLYYVVIRANNPVGTGTSLNSNEISYTTSTAAPTTLAATAATGQIALTWTAASGAASYRIYRGTTTTGPYSLIASGITSTNYSDTTVTNGTQYFYVVRAYNGTESGDSNEATALPIGSFTISSTSASSTTSIVVNWGTAAGATDYDVRYGTSTGSYSVTATGVTSPHTITGLTSNTTYYIIVRARNSVGPGTSANTPEVTQITPVAAPTALVATGGTGQVSLSWTAASGALTYKVLRGTTSGTYSEITSGISATTYTDTTPANGTTYYYVVRSFNGADSANSSEVLSQPISSFSISSITGSTSSILSVSWGAATGAATYDLKYGTTSGSYSTTLTNVTSPATITGLSAGTIYYVQMVAKNSVGTGTSVTSAESSGTTNSIPVISLISNQTTEAPNTINAAFTLSDSNDILGCTTSVTGVSTNTTLVPNANISFSGTMPNCTVTLTPAVGQTGTTTITLTASDGKDTANTSFDATFTPCTVASIAWEVQPTNIAAGSLWSIAPQVSLRKADGSLCTTNTNPVTLSVTFDTSTQQDAVVSGGNPATPSGGYATFSSATMTREGVGYKLAAGQGTILSLDSSTFNVTELAPTKVLWAVQPSTTNRTSNIIPEPTVRVTDMYGNYVAQSGIGITVSLLGNDEAATLGGTLSRNTDATGAAVFSGLTLDKVGNYYLRGTPSSTYAAIDSSTFDIIQIFPQTTVATLEMLNGSLWYDSPGNASYPGAAISFGTNTHDGTTAYTWKIVATNTSGQNATIRLKLAGNNIESITVPGNTTTPTLYSIAIANSSITAEGVWSMGTFKGTGIIYSSRIIVAQSNATRTQVYLPLTSMENSTTATLTSDTTSGIYTKPNEMNFPNYSWDSAKIARVDSLQLYSTVRTSSASACVALFNKSTNSQIGADSCTTSSSDAVLITSISPSVMPLTGELEVRIKNTGGGTTSLVRSGLLVRLVSIEKMIAVQRVAPAVAALTASKDFTEHRASSYISSYGVGTISEYLVCRAKANTSGGASFIYKNHGTNTSGISGSTTISSSTINYSTQTSYTTLEAGPVVTVNGNNQYLNYTHSSGSYALSHCLMETEVVYP